MGLTALPEAIGELTSLTTLDLSVNQLTVLPEAIGELASLTTLDVSGNPLTYPPPAVVADGSEAVVSFLRGARESSA